MKQNNFSGVIPTACTLILLKTAKNLTLTLTERSKFKNFNVLHFRLLPRLGACPAKRSRVKGEINCVCSRNQQNWQVTRHERHSIQLSPLRPISCSGCRQRGYFRRLPSMRTNHSGSAIDTVGRGAFIFRNARSGQVVATGSFGRCCDFIDRSRPAGLGKARPPGHAILGYDRSCLHHARSCLRHAGHPGE